MKFSQFLPNATILLLLAGAGVQAQAQVCVIVSSKNPITKLTTDQLSQIFLGQTTTFITGGRAEPLDQPETSALHQSFYTRFLGKNQAQMKAYWSKQAFSGRGSAPVVLPASAEVVKKVAENPKYIAYVDPVAVDGSVKVVSIQ